MNPSFLLFPWSWIRLQYNGCCVYMPSLLIEISGSPGRPIVNYVNLTIYASNANSDNYPLMKFALMSVSVYSYFGHFVIIDFFNIFSFENRRKSKIF
jgi:hypothetical protein